MGWEAWGTPDDFYGPDWRDDATDAGWLDPDDLGKAALDVLAERTRQETEEGWTPEHDDGHDEGQLARAAAAYAYGATMQERHRKFVSGIYSIANDRMLLDIWPHDWSRKWWKPADRRRDLVKAAALIVAEIERIDRAEKAEGAG
ncbi:hypothetical protein [Stappia sp. ES.058]|uniref:hypothetical protein n=1 Tax=Stappia sp. ES.058 TaxID=1881061 RepID=UPI00087CA462|nr:hypothetical protein [Stappia sp. ES.058]SDT96724.1 hypothetical protein SAMN05428979_0786 [Stappia sp. ES.058]